MFRSQYLSSSGRVRNAWSVFGVAHHDATQRMQPTHDVRPLWQRLDDEEDRQLIRQRKLTQGYRIATLAIVAATFLGWFLVY